MIALYHFGFVLVESSLVIAYLDEVFPEPPARPRVADWLARVKVLPSDAAAVDAWAVPAAVEMMRTQGKAAWPEIEPLTKRGS